MRDGISTEVLVTAVVVVVAIAGVGAYVFLGSGPAASSSATSETTSQPVGTTTSSSSHSTQSSIGSTSQTSSQRSTSTSPVTAMVTIGGSGSPNDGYYVPASITVVIGVNNTVTWTNGDSIAHTVTATDGSFNSGNMNQVATFTHTFTSPGVFSYYCAYHGFMKGTVTVKAPS